MDIGDLWLSSGGILSTKFSLSPTIGRERFGFDPAELTGFVKGGIKFREGEDRGREAPPKVGPFGCPAKLLAEIGRN